MHTSADNVGTKMRIAKIRFKGEKTNLLLHVFLSERGMELWVDNEVRKKAAIAFYLEK